MTTSIESLIELYGHRYSAHDANGVAELCEAPFTAIRKGVAIHLAEPLLRLTGSSRRDSHASPGVAVPVT
ncbi:hypothetical protein ACWEOW_01610 [Monashia sp. NPDC004114]